VNGIEGHRLVGLERWSSQPHNYNDALQGLDKPIALRDVRRAIDYVEAGLEQAVTVADRVAATGVAGRTLFMHFKNFKGVSPMRCLQNARLRRVRSRWTA